MWERDGLPAIVVVFALARIIKSVVTGQAPVTLELRNTPGKKHKQTKGGAVVATVLEKKWKRKYGFNPFRAPEALPILNPSNFVPKNGFPVVEGSRDFLGWYRSKSIQENVWAVAVEFS